MCILRLLLTIIYFNPRSYKRSDPFPDSTVNFCNISIHAPTRGATRECGRLMGVSDISIHAPTRGATIGAKFEHYRVVISIHAPTRGATSRLPYHLKMMSISIHAPTRGATSPCNWRSLFLQFQSTLLQEERRFILWFVFTVILFQSTLLQEERRS